MTHFSMSQNDEISYENNHFVNQDILSLMSYWKNYHHFITSLFISIFHHFGAEESSFEKN